MATIKLYDRLWDYTDWSDFFEPKTPRDIRVHKPTLFTYWPYTDIGVTITGSGFKYAPNGVATAGTIATVTVYYHGAPIISMTGVGKSLAAFCQHAFGAHANGSDALGILFTGNNKFIGENGSDISPAGPSIGNDTVLPGKGDDVVNGDHGNDILNGGPGYDVLTYQPRYNPTHKPVGAFRGINLDVALHTVIDAWGHRDTISNLEAYHGSWFPDVMRGSAGPDEFTGNRGADVIDGRGGADILWYNAEFGYGGTQGIVVDLENGRIKDSFGTVDKVSNVEIIAGTPKSDVFVGDAGNNIFAGLAGVDSYDGGAGDHDQISFIYNEHVGAFDGVFIDLSAGHVYDDGFANSESVVSIEDIRGSTLDDTLIGDSHDNVIRGETGNDRLEGNGGNDTLIAGPGDDSVIGGDGGDVLAGGPGNDFLWGGDGTDRASYTDATAGVTVSLALATPQDTGGAGTDTLVGIENLTGSNFDDQLTGNDGNNVLEGLDGTDTYQGGGGEDAISFFSNVAIGARHGVIVNLSLGSVSDDGFGHTEVFTSVEDVHGSAYADIITGDGGANRLDGDAGSDTLDGASGNDILDGGSGSDGLTGDGGADQFQFSAAVLAANADSVTDFVSGEGDTIALSKTVMNVTGSPGDILSATEFVNGPAATTPEQRIVYDQANGDLYYDADGSNSGAPVQIAHFNGSPTITSADILLIA